MEQIIGAHETILNILGKPQSAVSGYRLMKFCVSVSVQDGVLLHNLLTQELVLMTQEEFDNACQQDYLRKHWFVVPRETREHELVQMVRWVRLSSQRGSGITTYTIFTTCVSMFSCHLGSRL